MNLKLYTNSELTEDKFLPFEYVDNQIIFEYKEMNNSINFNNKVFKRENDEYIFTLDISNKEANLLLKNENYTLQLEVEYANLTKKENKIELSYKLNTEEKIILKLDLGDMTYDNK